MDEMVSVLPEPELNTAIALLPLLALYMGALRAVKLELEKDVICISLPQLTRISAFSASFVGNWIWNCWLSTDWFRPKLRTAIDLPALDEL